MMKKELEDYFEDYLSHSLSALEYDIRDRILRGDIPKFGDPDVMRYNAEVRKYSLAAYDAFIKSCWAGKDFRGNRILEEGKRAYDFGLRPEINEEFAIDDRLEDGFSDCNSDLELFADYIDYSDLEYQQDTAAEDVGFDDKDDECDLENDDPDSLRRF